MGLKKKKNVITITTIMVKTIVITITILIVTIIVVKITIIVVTIIVITIIVKHIQLECCTGKLLEEFRWTRATSYVVFHNLSTAQQ